MEAREKILQYGSPAMTTEELLQIVGYRGTLDDYYKSFNFVAAKELERRRLNGEVPIFSGPTRCYQFFRHLEDLSVECFYMATLKVNGGLINSHFISKGCATHTIVDIKEIAKNALDDGANAVILAHNHPSGAKKPSDQDLTITKRITEALSLFNIKLFDHIIVAKDNGYYSFSENGDI